MTAPSPPRLLKYTSQANSIKFQIDSQTILEKGGTLSSIQYAIAITDMENNRRVYASIQSTSSVEVKNLIPYMRYKLTVQGVNAIGTGPEAVVYGITCKLI